MKTTTKNCTDCQLGLFASTVLGELPGRNEVLEQRRRGSRRSHRQVIGPGRGSQHEPRSVDEPAGRESGHGVQRPGGTGTEPRRPAQPGAGKTRAAIQRPNAGQTRRNPETERGEPGRHSTAQRGEGPETERSDQAKCRGPVGRPERAQSTAECRGPGDSSDRMRVPPGGQCRGPIQRPNAGAIQRPNAGDARWYPETECRRHPPRKFERPGSVARGGTHIRGTPGFPRWRRVNSGPGNRLPQGIQRPDAGRPDDIQRPGQLRLGGILNQRPGAGGGGNNIGNQTNIATHRQTARMSASAAIPRT